MSGLAPVGAGLLAAACLWVLLLPADAGRLGRAVRPRSGPVGGSRGAAWDDAVARADHRAAGGAAAARRAAPSASGARIDARENGRTSGAGPQRPGATAPAGRPATGRLPPATGACLLAGAALSLLLPLPSGPLLGLLLVVTGPRAFARLEPRSAREQRERLRHDLPLVLDLLASCLAGGAPLPVAADAVARAVGGPAGARLADVSAALGVGASPAEAWRMLAGHDPAHADADPLGPAARALSRAADGGAPVAAAVSRLAAEARADARSHGEQAARRVGVLAVAPLGLCFLPAFVLLGVVPVVIGLAGPLLATL